MVDFSKYPVKGNCRFPSIFEQLAIGSVETATITRDRPFLRVWKIGINLSETNGQMHLIPFFSYKCEAYRQCRIGYYLGIKNLDYFTKIVVLPSECQAPGFCLKFLDLKPELLDDGALVIEYGIRVEALQMTNNIWTFQLLCNLFDSKGKQVMTSFRKNEIGRCHPQIRAIHDKSIEIKGEGISFCLPLQIAHGVRYQEFDLLLTARNAHAMGLRNVVQYCQWQMIKQPFTNHNYLESNEIKIAVNLEMRSYLVHSIRECKTKNKLINTMKALDMKKMSGESMKTFMKFILYSELHCWV